MLKLVEIETEQTEIISISFDDYNNLCSECDKHNTCHKNKSINWDKVQQCLIELSKRKNLYLCFLRDTH